MYNFLFPIIQKLFRVSLRVISPEGFNRLCIFLPGRLILEGLRYYGASIGQDVIFTPPIVFHNHSDDRAAFKNLRIGDACYFGRSIFMDLKGGIVIADRVTVAMGVMIVTHTDVASSPLGLTVMPSTADSVIIQSGVYIGARATILQGVTVGECAVIAAGALVNRSVPSRRVYGGVPAHELKKLDLSE